MVLTRSELVSSLKHEVHILLHLAGKIDRSMLDYRPTPKQRSVLELLQYLTIMGPSLLQVAKTGTFDVAGWTNAEKEAAGRDFDATIAAIASQAETYPALIAGFTDDELRAEIAPFGEASSRGAFIVNLVLCGCAAYRTQLFVYLKACGRTELSTINLWVGMDAPAGS